MILQRPFAQATNGLHAKNLGKQATKPCDRPDTALCIILQKNPKIQYGNPDFVAVVSDLPEADQVPRDVPLQQHGPLAEAAARPLPLQPVALDPHPGGRAGELE